MMVIGKLNSLLGRPEQFFVILASIFGLLFLSLVPPFQTPDENVHFYRAYEVSQLYRDRTIQAGETGSLLPRSIRLTEETVHGTVQAPGSPNQLQFNPNEKYDLRYTKSALLDIPLNNKDKIFYKTGASPAYNPVVYLPQATMVAIGRVLSLPIITILYMTRAINLCIWIVVAYLCIKNFPWKRWALAGVCLLPVTVSQTISPGLDVLALASILVFLTLIFKAIADKEYRVTTKWIVVLGLSALLMVFAKSTLAAFFPLIFLIRRDQIALRYHWVLKFLIITVPILLYLLWTMLTAGANDVSVQASSKLQMAMLVSNPLHFIHLLLNTIFFITPSGNLLAQSIVGNFGWMDTALSPPFVFFGIVFMAFMFFVSAEQNRARFSRRAFWLMVVAAAGSVIATFMAMYLYFSATTDNHIKGVNGRYLIPVAFMLIPIFLNSNIVTTKATYVRVIQVGSVVLLTVSILTIIARYYFVFLPT